MKKILTILFAVVFAMMCFGCEGRDEGEKIDTKKTQIYVDAYNGGFGSDWLNALETRFEEAYKDYKGEGDKVGVQIIATENPRNGSGILNNIAGSNVDVYFTESLPYYDVVSRELALDVTDIVINNNSDGKTIESKLADSQKNYYKNNNKYFGLPHFAVYGGIVYNVDVFEEYDLYFSDTPSFNGGFVVPETEKSHYSKGPDGVLGTYDDGLPATYDEFFKLLKRMTDMGVIPFTWSGQYGKAYIHMLLNSIMTEYLGKEQSELEFNFGGNDGAYAEYLVDSISSSGEVSLKDPVKITAENGYEVYGNAGRYYAIKFLERIFEQSAYYDKNNIDNTVDSHTDAQTRFVLSNYDPSATPIAMFVDGCYWENEVASVGVFKTLETVYSVSRKDVRFAQMPLPKADESRIGDKPVLVDTSSSLAFINSNVATRSPERVEICKEFLKFAYTDQSLQEFTVVTNTPKNLQYSLTAEQEGQLYNYAKSLFTIKQNADEVYTFSTNPIFIANQSLFNFSTMYQTNNYAFVYDAMKQGVSAKKYFEDIVSYRNAKWWNDNFSNFFNK